MSKLSNKDLKILIDLYRKKLCESPLDVAIHNAVNELKKYRDLEEQGLLLKLPSSVGSKVYSICDGNIFELEMTLELYAQRHNLFGITMFTTKEAAEQELKRLER